MKKFLVLILFLLIQTAMADTTQQTSMNFDKVPVRVALESIAKFTHQNFMISPGVMGEVTLYLDQVSYEEALQALLKSQGLAKLQEGNIIYIAPQQEIERKEQDALEHRDIPLTTIIIHLKYAKAAEVAQLLKNKEQQILSAQAQVTADARTNSLLIKERSDKINEVKKLLTQLDVAVPQVAIEARIVNIDDDYEKELGIRFGLTSGRHVSGSLAGANDIAGGEMIAKVNPESRLNVDLPSAMKQSGSIGLALFKLTQGTLLDLELSALESEGRAEIISTPRLLTANQQPAMIESGEEIPYQELASSQGATTTSFKKAVLRLQVTPQITPNGKIILSLEVNQDKRSNQEIQGVPAIDTRKITTQVLVSNGQTVVLGGIYEQTRINGVDRVPFFSDLPGIGVLFRHKKTVNNRRELLIFVTPNIVN